MTSRKQKALGLGSLLIATFAAQGCTDGDSAPAIQPSVVLIDRTDQPLVAGTLRALIGTYDETTCTGRTGAWSLLVDGTAANDVNLPGGLPPRLTVVATDTDCDLDVTGVLAGPNTATYVEYTSRALNLLSVSVLPLDDDDTMYEVANARAFAAAADGSPTGASFYGNAIRTAPSNGAFAIEFTFSSDPAGLTVDPVPILPAVPFAVSATGEALLVPNYTLAQDPTTPLVYTRVGLVGAGVTTVDGVATLATSGLPAGITAVGYVISPAAINENSTFAQVDAAFRAISAADGTPVGTPLSAMAITAALVGPTGVVTDDLDGVAIIIAAEGTDAEDVRVYQVIRLNFVVGYCEPGVNAGTDDCVCPPGTSAAPGALCVAVAPNICGPAETEGTDDCVCDDGEDSNLASSNLCVPEVCGVGVEPGATCIACGGAAAFDTTEGCRALAECGSSLVSDFAGTCYCPTGRVSGSDCSGL